MIKLTKLGGCALLLSGFFVPQITANCPELDQKELRRICRWEGLTKIPLLKIKAGTITKDGITLTNELGTCGEKDSLKQFFLKKHTTLYPGVLTKDPLEPQNQQKGLCTYDLDGEKIGFNVTFPKPPTKNTEKKKKLIRGVDITTSPEEQEFELKGKSALHSGEDASTSQVPPVKLPAAQLGEGRVGLKHAPSPQQRKNQLAPQLQGSPPPNYPPPSPPLRGGQG